MNDRTTRILLAAVLGLLAANLVRPALVARPAQAQAPAAAPAGTSAIASSNNFIYTLRGDELSVFYFGLGNGNPFEALKLLGDEKDQEEVLKTAKLRLLLRQDISRLPGAAARKE